MCLRGCARALDTCGCLLSVALERRECPFRVALDTWVCLLSVALDTRESIVYLLASCMCLDIIKNYIRTCLHTIQNKKTTPDPEYVRTGFISTLLMKTKHVRTCMYGLAHLSI